MRVRGGIPEAYLLKNPGGYMTGRCFLVLFAVAALSAVPLQAAELTVFVGGANPGSISYDNIETALDSGPVYGFRFRTSFVPSFGLEHTLAFSSDYLFPSGAALREAKGFVYNSNLIIDFPMKLAVPYITAGAGLIHQYGDGDMPVGTKFAFNYGGGLRFPRLAGPFGLRIDLRGYSTAPFSDDLNIFEISGGVLISLGK
jgi:hypothetical protein